MSSEASPVRQYAVFISYRHADNKDMGRKWANWLHEALEHYEIPADLIGTTDLRGGKVPASLYPVFRDEEELPADADLTTNITRALDHSAQLVVLCSPRAVQSMFVADEIRYFKEIGKSHCILALMIDGEPNASEDPVKLQQMGPEMECFPQPLRYGVPDQETGKIDWTRRTEPIAADVRPASRPVQGWTTAAAYEEELDRQGKLTKSERADAVREYAAQLELAKLKVVAGALGLPLGVLTQRDKAAQLAKAQHRAKVLRRWLAAVGVLMVMAIAGGLVAWQQYQEADRQFREANRQLERSVFQEGKFWIEKSGTARESDDSVSAVMLAGRALGFQGFGRRDPMPAAFTERFPFLLGKPFQSDATLEARRTEAAAEALQQANAFPSNLPIWSSPVPSEENKVAMRHTAFSPDGTLLATAMADHTVRIWNTVTGRETSKLTGPGEAVTSVAFSPDGAWLAGGSQDSKIWLFDLGTEAPPRSLEGHSDAVRAVAFSPDGSQLASCSSDGTIKLWNPATGQEIRTIKGHNDEVLALAFSPDGKWLVSGSAEPTVKLWDAATGQELRTLPAHVGNVTAVAFSPDGWQVATVSKDGVLRLSNPEDGTEIRVLDTTATEAAGLSFSPDNLWLATGVRVYSLNYNKVESRSLSHSSTVTGVQFSPDSLRLATCSTDGMVKLADMRSGTHEFRPMRGHRGTVHQAAFSDDGRLVASGGEDALLHLWDTASQMQTSALAGHEGEIKSVRFSPDGILVASGSDDRTIRLWDVATGRQLRALTGHPSSVERIAFSPDGTLLASASKENLILWDISTGGIVHGIPLTDFEVNTLCFSPDGSTLAAVSADIGPEMLDDPAVPRALSALKLWKTDGMVSQPVPALGARQEIVTWVEKANRMMLPDESAQIHIFDQVLELAPPDSPPPTRDLVQLLETGLLRETEHGTFTAEGGGFTTSRPPLMAGTDYFSQLLTTEDIAMQFRLCAHLGKSGPAMALWTKHGANASPAARRLYFFILTAAVREGAALPMELLPLLDKTSFADPSISGAMMATLRSLPAQDRPAFLQQLESTAPEEWLNAARITDP